MVKLKTNSIHTLLEKLPCEIYSNIQKRFQQEGTSKINEIRINLFCPLIVLGNEEYIFENLIITKELLHSAIRALTNNSLFSYEREILQGYFTIEGGHRIGVAGKFTSDGKRIISLNSITGLNIRVAKSIEGIGIKVIKHILNPSKSIYNTLIVSPPGCGKTTLLRDIVRILSNGEINLSFGGFRVVVIDERSEISTYSQEQSKLGTRTFVLDGVDKLNGVFMAIRSLNPQIIAMDELGGPQDYLAVAEASKMGVKVIATMHGENLHELKKRTYSKRVLEQNVFEKVIFLSSKDGPGTVEEIITLGDK
ncbi:AAA family ATPase [Caldicellulosiruptor saccharolyticus]|uniref:AAA family ATPase n=1 Tax=Caldicellulosiruptor saccharolyticus TaxID=44001 RepID=UPI0005A1CD0C|nr:AAA family ATPase [Caldicellulosiruptor saccharolyticus]